MRKSLSDRLIAVIALAISAVVFLALPHDVPGTSLATFADMESAAFFPMLAATLVGVSAVMLAVGSLNTSSRRADDDVDAIGPRPVLMVIGFCIFIPLIHGLGMVTASAITILVLPLVFGYRDYRWILPLAVLLPFAVYGLFEKILKVLFPHGAVF